MAKQSLLVADSDPRSLRILDVALRKAGFQVATASEGNEAWRRIQREPPDLLLADITLPGQDGIALCKALRADGRLAGTPVIIISTSKDAALKLAAHEAGADDFLGKPLLIKELTTRIRMLLARSEQQKQTARGSQANLAGSIGEMGLVDLFQQLDSDQRSAVIACDERDRRGRIWVRDGQVVDAESGALGGEAAFYRMLGWETGKFFAEFVLVDREARIEQSTQALLAESVRRVDELERLSQELPLATVLSVDFAALGKRLVDLPDEVNGVIRLCDGHRTIAQVMERAPVDELSVLAVLQRLIAERVLLRGDSPGVAKSKPSLMQWLGPDSVATPAPPIMGAHGFPQSGDPTPIAPPVSDPPTPIAPEAAPVAVARSIDPIETVVQPVEPQRASSDSPSAVFEDEEEGDSPDEAARVGAAQHTETFRLPAVAKQAVPIVRFAPLRGVRRERLRREADEARARVADGQSVRLTNVVELPAWSGQPGDPRRRISPAVGEAARKFAPDLPMGGPEESHSPEQNPEAPLEQSPEVARAADAVAPAQDGAVEPKSTTDDDGDVHGASATLQVAPLSAELLAHPGPVEQPAAQEQEHHEAAPQENEHHEAAPQESEHHEAAPQESEHQQAAPQESEHREAAPQESEHREAAPVSAASDASPEVVAAAAAITGESEPVRGTQDHGDHDFDAEMRAALGKNKKRWPLWLGAAAVVALLVYFFRPQPPTDRKDAPWLKAEQAGAPDASTLPTNAAANPAVANADGGTVLSANDSGPAAANPNDAGAVQAAPTPKSEPVATAAVASADAGAPVDDYARALEMGELMLKRGKYRPAIIELQKAVKLNAESVPALLDLGDAWLESDKPRTALKFLEKAAKLDPKSSRAQLLMGTAWQSLGKTADAVKAYERYLEMDPSGEYARDVRSILSNLQK